LEEPAAWSGSRKRRSEFSCGSGWRIRRLAHSLSESASSTSKDSERELQADVVDEGAGRRASFLCTFPVIIRLAKVGFVPPLPGQLADSDCYSSDFQAYISELLHSSSRYLNPNLYHPSHGS
jgi:hypothetical protein